MVSGKKTDIFGIRDIRESILDYSKTKNTQLRLVSKDFKEHIDKLNAPIITTTSKYVTYKLENLILLNYSGDVTNLFHKIQVEATFVKLYGSKAFVIRMLISNITMTVVIEGSIVSTNTQSILPELCFLAETKYKKSDPLFRKIYHSIINFTNQPKKSTINFEFKIEKNKDSKISLRTYSGLRTFFSKINYPNDIQRKYHNVPLDTLKSYSYDFVKSSK